MFVCFAFWKLGCRLFTFKRYLQAQKSRSSAGRILSNYGWNYWWQNTWIHPNGNFFIFIINVSGSGFFFALWKEGCRLFILKRYLQAQRFSSAGRMPFQLFFISLNKFSEN